MIFLDLLHTGRTIQDVIKLVHQQVPLHFRHAFIVLLHFGVLLQCSLYVRAVVALRRSMQTPTTICVKIGGIGVTAGCLYSSKTFVDPLGAGGAYAEAGMVWLWWLVK